MTVAEIGDKFPVNPPVISQYLKALREVRLVQVEIRVQRHICRMNPEAVLELEEWARHLAPPWNQRFEVQDQVLEMEKKRLEG